METSAQSRRELDVVDASTEPTLHRSIHLSRRANLLTSPLLRLPTELIHWIFLQAIEISPDDDRPVSLVLTAICHQLREIGIASPQLWGTIDLTTPPIAELFLERCKRNPHTLKLFPTTSKRPSMCPRREILWEKLGGCTFDALRSITFEGTTVELAFEVVGIVRRAPNVSNLDLCTAWFPHSQGHRQPFQELLHPIGSPMPDLSTLRLRGIPIDWTSPLLRNLTKLVLVHPILPPEYTSINVFLTALSNCPGLEILGLAHTGPEMLADGDTVVQLHRLRELSLEFRNPSRIGFILSHIVYPESTKLAVYIPVVDTDPPEILSRVFPRQNTQTARHLHKSTTLTICLGNKPHFSTDNLFVYFHEPDLCLESWENPLILTRFACKIVEVVGGDTITSLNIHVEAREISPPGEVWEILLHRLPRLKCIHYDLTLMEEDYEPLDFFALVFSQPHEGGPVCPQLQHLQLPLAVLAYDPSATILKHALTERDACGRRLKRIGISGDGVKAADRLALEWLRGLVDEVW